MDKLTLITSNDGKRREFSTLVGFELSSCKLDLFEPQHWDVSVVAKSKAEQAFSRLDTPVIVDDSAIEVTGWNGLPGALTSWFLDRIGNIGILKMAQSLDDKSASVLTAIGYCDASGVHTFIGRVTGKLAEKERGSNGFGYDKIFIPDGDTRTYAEMSDKEKNAISMRKLAIDKLLHFLNRKGRNQSSAG